MKTPNALRMLQCAALLAAACATAPVLAAPTAAVDNAACPYMGDMQARMTKFHQERLDRLHAALKLTPAQQGAWQAYAKAEMAMRPPMSPPAANADPATMAQFRADMAARMAQRLSDISKGTAALWKTLSPAQRTTFEQMAPRGHGGRHGMMGGRPPMQGQPEQPPAPDAQ